jgi:hypothetical protein
VQKMSKQTIARTKNHNFWRLASFLTFKLQKNKNIQLDTI